MINDADRAQLEQQLGRSPDGFQEVIRRMPDGTPAVIRVASVVNGIPFPTLFWISDPQLSELIYRHESRGTTQDLQTQIDESETLQARIHQDNLDHIQLRESYFDEATNKALSDLGVLESFAKKGVGGNANLTRIRCLHAWIGAHIIQSNVVGELLTQHCEKDDPLVIALSKLH